MLRVKSGFLSSRGRGVKQKGGSNARKTTMTSGKDVEGVSSMISSDQPLVGQFTSFSDAYGSPSPFTLEEILGDIKRQICEGKLVLVGDDGKPLKPSRLTMYERYGEYYWIARNSRYVPMNCLSLNIQGIGSKAKKEWIRELNIKHKVNFLTLQETKMYSISAMDVKLLWGNYNFDHVFSEVVGNSGGILCTWDSNVFHKEQHIISDNFVALYGTWNPNKAKLLMIFIYAPQSTTGKRSLWSYITSLITRWNGDCMVMGDFNEVRCMEDRMGSVFNVQGANEFNNLFSNSGLVEVQLEGYSFTWSHPSATKMSKLDRFLVTEDKGGVNDEILLSRMDLLKQMQDIKSSDARDCMENAKIQWAIEGDENSKFFHGHFFSSGCGDSSPSITYCGVDSSHLCMGSVALSLMHTVRGGVEAHPLDLLQNLIGSTILTNLEDIWVWDLNGKGVFRVKDLRNLLDDSFLPKDSTATRWVKSIPIKTNVFAWKVYLDRLPTRLKLIRRGIQVPSLSCPVCNVAYEDMSHLLFSCDLANDVVPLVCRWWNLTWSPFGSYSEWLSWFNSISLCSRIKGMLEGVFYVTWWCLWNFRNQLLFATQNP
nr:RNA-directed DNA polymerase, eukaryota [Tanacetum cinerariifolium]